MRHYCVLCFADIDECVLGIDDCGLNASCDNTPSGFTCSCDPGFTGDGYECTRKLYCDLST